MDSLAARGIVVFSGGSAANNLVDVFSELTGRRKSPLSYIIGVYCLHSDFHPVTDGPDRSVTMADPRVKSLEYLEVLVLGIYEVYFSDIPMILAFQFL